MYPELDPSLSYSGFAAEVRAGLTKAGQKTLPCQYFYDSIGTALFQAICLLPEYGLTRADDRIIRAHAADLAEFMPSPAIVVELGSGSGAKTRYVLDALARREQVVYYPIDVSAAALESCRQALCDIAEVRPLQASYVEGLRQAAFHRHPGQSLLVLFLGSTIGNFERREAGKFLLEVRAHLRKGDALLLGTDLEKPETEMLPAYDDPQGVTAAFNLNLLTRINRELRGNFVHRNFSHEAVYNRPERRIEMHLRSRLPQLVDVRDAGITVSIREDETIWTESSHKFNLSEIRELAARGGFRCAEQWVDDEWYFAENVLFPNTSTPLVREPAAEVAVC